MSQPHRMDPPAQHRAAQVAGVLAARGVVEGPPLLLAIQRAAREAAPGVDPRGLAMRLSHRYGDALADTLAARDATRGRVLAALAPLLDGRAVAPALLAAADTVEGAGALSHDERRALVAAAILRRLRGMRR